MKKSLFFIILFTLLGFVLISLKNGFGYITEKLTVNSKISIDGSGWNIYFKNIDNNYNNIYDIKINSDDYTSPLINFNVDLLNPGDEYSFFVDVINNGNLDGIVDGIELKTLSELESKYLEYYVTYYDDVDINNGDLLSSKKNDKIKISIKFKSIDDFDYNNIVKDFNLYVKLKYAPKEEHSKERYKNLSRNVKIGDVVYYKSLNDNYTVNSYLSGYNGDQVIDLSNLFLWDIVKVNEDGTVVAISKYSSSSYINISGSVGFKNYAELLNNISNEYNNENYVLNSRNFGYNGQSLVIDDFSMGNDDLYLMDFELIKNSLGNSSTTDSNSNLSNYATSSRFFIDENNYGIRVVDNDGQVKNLLLFDGNDVNQTVSFRPIIVFKSNLLVSGNGSINLPYTFK